MGIKQIIKAALFSPLRGGRWGLPLLLEGIPGDAKTAVINEIGAETGLHIETLIGSTRVPEDFIGIPTPDAQHEYATRLADAWVKRVYEHDAAVLFLDEFNWAQKGTSAAMLRVINERTSGDHTLPLRLRMLAVQNPVDEGGGNELTSAMANRFGHLKWEGVTAEEWGDWLLTADDAAQPAASVKTVAHEEARVLAAWPVAWAMARASAAAFVKRKPDLLRKKPSEASAAAAGAWPSLRTWEFATRALAAGRVHGLTEDDTDRLISAFIGAGPASEWATWRTQADLPDPYDVLDGRVKFDHNPRRLDRTEAVLSMCAAVLAPKPVNATSTRGEDAKAHTLAVKMRHERANKLWGILGNVMSDAADICVPAFQVLVNAQLALTPECKPVASPVLARIQPLLKASQYVAR